MNYFAHGRRYVDDPYFLAGTAVPDWLSVVDRRVRVRAHQAQPFTAAADPRLARVAAGIVQHCRDDQWFHATRAFAELSLALGQSLARELPADQGFRPRFLAHILVEILLDAVLIADEPERLADYYAAIETIETAAVQQAVNQISQRSTDNLATFIGLFLRERFLADYLDDGKLLVRLNQVMRRVGLSVLPEGLRPSLADARLLVAARKNELLAA